MTDETNLADILSGDVAEEPTGENTSEEATATPVVEAEEKTEPETAQAETEEGTEESPRDEKGRFVPKKEADSYRAAMLEERRKRQELEQKLNQKPEEKKDFFEDPDGAIEQRLSKERSQFDGKFFRLSEHLARDRYKDYDEVVAELVEAATADPSIAEDIYPRASAHVDPAGFLYTQALQRRELAVVDGDISKYREGIESPLKAEIAERDKKIADLEKQLAGLGRVRTSMNDESSVSSATAQNDEAAEPTPMTSILKAS